MAVTIIDYGMGNIASIQNMLKKVGSSSVLCSSAEELKDAQKIILPGVGSFDNAVQKLQNLGIMQALKDKANKNDCFILGICLGMQLLSLSSEEGQLEGLGLIPGKVKKFKLSANYKIPHMGWNRVKTSNVNPLLKSLDVNKFYFVHSYYFQPEIENYSIGTTMYGEEFCSMVNKDKVYGAQFHPEKSHKYGMQLFRNFLEL